MTAITNDPPFADARPGNQELTEADFHAVKGLVAQAVQGRLRKRHVEEVLRQTRRPGIAEIAVQSERRSVPFFNKMTICVRRTFLDGDGRVVQEFVPVLNVSPKPYATAPDDPRNLAAVGACNQIAEFLQEVVAGSRDPAATKALQDTILRSFLSDEDVELIEEQGQFDVVARMATDNNGVGYVTAYVETLRREVEGGEGETEVELLEPHTPVYDERTSQEVEHVEA